MTRLKDVATVRVSNVDKKSYDGEHPVRLCNYTDVYYGDSLSASATEYMPATASSEQVRNFRLIRGDTVLTKDSETADDIGVSAFIEESADDFVCGYHLAILRPDWSAIDPKFLFWITRASTFRQQLTVAATGVTRFGLRTEALANVSLLLPPLDEQRRIADFLDDQVERLDRAIRLRERQTTLEVARYAEYREAVVEDDDSPRRPLGHLVDPARPINYGVLMPGPRLQDGVPLVEAGDVMRGPLSISDLRRTDPSIEADFKRSRLRTGDLVMAIRGSVGRVQVVPEVEEVINVTRDAARISLSRNSASSRYVRHALSTRRVQDWLRLRILGSAVTGINIGDLRKVPVAVPLLAEQERRAVSLDAAEADLMRLMRLFDKSQTLLSERKQALITAAVTGEFDVTAARGAA